MIFSKKIKAIILETNLLLAKMCNNWFCLNNKLSIILTDDTARVWGNVWNAIRLLYFCWIIPKKEKNSCSQYYWDSSLRYCCLLIAVSYCKGFCLYFNILRCNSVTLYQIISNCSIFRSVRLLKSNTRKWFFVRSHV